MPTDHGTAETGGAIELDEAVALALKSLARRERTIAETRKWLRGRKVESRLIDPVVARLCEIGALDDARYADLYAQDKRELAGWGERRIRAGLEEKGVDRDEIDRVMAAESHSEQVERGVALVAERIPSSPGDRDRARALALLARRGFPEAVAYEAVRAAEAGR